MFETWENNCGALRQIDERESYVVPLFVYPLAIDFFPYTSYFHVTSMQGLLDTIVGHVPCYFLCPGKSSLTGPSCST